MLSTYIMTEKAATAVVPPYFSKKKLNTIDIIDIEKLLKNSLEPLARMRRNTVRLILPLV